MKRCFTWNILTVSEVCLDPEIMAFSKLLKKVDCSLSTQQLKQFDIYLQLLLSWSKRTNLVSSKDRSRLVFRHFLESVAVLFSIELPRNAVVLDLGTGGGFPGVPMKIVRPDLKFVLLDSKRMKCLFLRKVIKELSFENTTVVCERVENVSQEYEHFFDYVVTRAVAPINELWGWGSPLLKNNGKLVAMKGGDLSLEIVPFKQKSSAEQVEVCSYHKTLVKNDDKKIIIIQS